MSVTGTNPRIALSAIGPDVDLPLGQVIPGSRYRILSRIGRGGMGAVYEAEHVDLQKRVALKVLLNQTAVDAKRVAAFLREARTASRISSPYIADVTDFGDLSDGRVYFVMEHIEGTSLGRLLRAGVAFDETRAIPILRQLAKALGAVHEKGVAHLDVKPDNIMLLERGHRSDAVKMVDFGIAGLLEESRSGTKTISGTPEYVSPERISARGYDHRSDIYSFGIVAYELLTGLAPFRNPTAVETLKLHLEKAPLPMAMTAPDRRFSSRLEETILQCLEKDPADRPANMATVEALLCEAQIGSGLSTSWDDLELPPVDDEWRRTLAERMPSPAGNRRKIMIWASSSSALVAILVALYFGVIREPKVVIREVRVDVTKTTEAAEVAAWVIRAEQAVRRQHFVDPFDGSALSYVERAESEAKKLGIVSDGARYMRTTAAASLMALGGELDALELFELSIVKYREALRFLPGDLELQARAQIEPGEIEVFLDRAEWSRRPASKRTRRAAELAANVYAATRKGMLSQARLSIEELAKLDTSGSERSRLADGLRRMANAAWDEGMPKNAEPLYEVIATLDPKDIRSVDRARGTPTRVVAETTKPKPTPVLNAARKAVAPVVDDAGMKRDVAAAVSSVNAGRVAMKGAKFGPAESAFRAAIAADPRNPEGFGGLAEVSFEKARYEEAVEWARQAVRRSPKSARYHALLGDSYFKLFRTAEAASSYRLSLSLDPDNREVASRLKQVEGR